ncbi:DUF6519 domain-containing protein [Paraburkholderia sp. MM5384-R2]|uniref:DUF6519 domain-containing protein n=1 Tax=Paraburkholderia sp. MM5384-R2 TaxID=2723097 RepID=UPI00162275B4|nr:DUF6519 domain-containing protein [Paraburkholderia sp. MM5384-R2]MBB5503103.1 hypothetical protein [Paraburkholderia sp. MM5384-R2]
MKGDFSRIRFEQNKHYTDVLDQQGRVAYDADHNEQRFIDRHRRAVETVDVIGEYGAPMHDPGFAITVTGNNLSIGAGRYYVHGLLCENAAALAYDQQPFRIAQDETDQIGFLLDEMRRNRRNACLCVYLEVWQRMVTALDDSCLGEPALGQADTTTRMQTVWRVVAYPFAPGTPSSANASGFTAQDPSSFALKVRACSCDAMYRATPVERTGTLCAQVADRGDDCGCQPIPAAGYTGQENQLYRFEIHRSGTLATATLKWSRENGSIVVAIASVSGNKVTVNSLGMDANLGFQEGQWVEISDDTNLFGEEPNQPGQLYQIQHIDRPSMTLVMTTTVQPVDTTRNARLRRWDQVGSAATADGVALSDKWFIIENGIQIRFGTGTYFAGDAWTIAARNATGQIDWPPCGNDGKPCQPAYYAHIYRAPLACIGLSDTDDSVTTDTGMFREAAFAEEVYSPFKVEDCRRRFPSLTELGGFVNAKALHITAINWQNDDVMTFDALVAHGLEVDFDQPPTGPLSSANFIVTLETPIQLQTQAALGNELNAPVQNGYPTPTVIRTEFILDSTVQRQGTAVTWTLPSENVSSHQIADLQAINSGLVPWAFLGTPVRARVKLPGRALYASTAAGAQLYLDGQAFGQSVISKTEQRERIDLQLPTGNDARASDFESWFYLYPALALESVAFTYAQLFVADIEGTAGIVNAEPNPIKPLVQQATIELNYAATVAATIQLAMSGDSSIASVPSTVAVNAGDSGVRVNVTINGAPVSDQQSRFTLTASLPSALNQATSQTASFTVIGRGGKPAPAPAQAQPIAETKTVTETETEMKTQPGEASAPSVTQNTEAPTPKATPAKRPASPKRKRS